MNLIELGIEKGIIKFDEEQNFITYIQQNKKRNYNNPEEKVQAETFLTLVLIYGYAEKRIKQFVSVQMGSETKEADLIAARDLILSKYGKIDGLVNAAGGNMPDAVVQSDQDIFKLNMDALQQVINLNLFGTLLPTQIFGEAMKDTVGRGSIVNISSVSTVAAMTKVLGYSLAKSAIDSYTKWFAVELSKRYGDKIRMNSIAPGFFLTEQNRTLLQTQTAA